MTQIDKIDLGVMLKPKSIVFDLDDTICFPNLDIQDTNGRYAMAKPNMPVIVKMRELEAMGYEIIISTARRMLTHNGNIEAIIEDVGDVTREWLDKYNVPWTKIEFGKPYSSTYYVDDKAMRPEEFLKTNFTTPEESDTI